MKNGAIILAIILLSGCFRGANENKEFIGKPLPSFNILLIDSVTQLNTNNILFGHKTVFLFISPYCPYCKAQTQQIIKDIKLFGKTQFYILSNFPFETLKQYYTDNQLNKYPNITVAQDYTSTFPTFFNVQRIPYLAIFDKNNIVKQIRVGKVSTDQINNILAN